MNESSEQTYKRYMDRRIKYHLKSETIRDFNLDSLEKWVDLMADENLEEKSQEMMLENLNNLLTMSRNTQEYTNFVYGLLVKKQALLDLKKSEKNILIKEISNVNNMKGPITDDSTFSDQLRDIVSNLSVNSSNFDLKWRSMKESIENQSNFVDENEHLHKQVSKPKPSPESNIDFGEYHKKQGDEHFTTKPEVNKEIKIPPRKNAQTIRQQNIDINQVNPNNYEQQVVENDINELDKKVNEYNEKNVYKFNPLKHAVEIFKNVIRKDAQKEDDQEFQNFMNVQRPPQIPLHKPNFFIKVKTSKILNSDDFPRTMVKRTKISQKKSITEQLYWKLKNIREIKPIKEPNWMRKILNIKPNQTLHIKIKAKKSKYKNFKSWMKVHYKKNNSKTNPLLKSLQSSAKKSYLVKFINNNSYTKPIKQTKQKIANWMQIKYHKLKQHTKILKSLEEENKVILEQLENCRKDNENASVITKCLKEKLQRYNNNIRNNAKLKFSIFKKIMVIRKSLAKSLFYEKKLNAKNKEITKYFQKKAIKKKNSAKILKTKVYKSNLNKLILYNKRQLYLKKMNQKKINKKIKYIVNKFKFDKKNLKKKVIGSIDEKNKKIKHFNADLVMEQKSINFWSKKATDIKSRILNLRKNKAKPKEIQTLRNLIKLISKKVDFHSLKVKLLTKSIGLIKFDSLIEDKKLKTKVTNPIFKQLKNNYHEFLKNAEKIKKLQKEIGKNSSNVNHMLKLFKNINSKIKTLKSQKVKSQMFSKLYKSVKKVKALKHLIKNIKNKKTSFKIKKVKVVKNKKKIKLINKWLKKVNKFNVRKMINKMTKKKYNKKIIKFIKKKIKKQLKKKLKKLIKKFKNLKSSKNLKYLKYLHKITLKKLLKKKLIFKAELDKKKRDRIRYKKILKALKESKLKIKYKNKKMKIKMKKKLIKMLKKIKSKKLKKKLMKVIKKKIKKQKEQKKINKLINKLKETKAFKSSNKNDLTDKIVKLIGILVSKAKDNVKGAENRLISLGLLKKTKAQSLTSSLVTLSLEDKSLSENVSNYVKELSKNPEDLLKSLALFIENTMQNQKTLSIVLNSNRKIKSFRNLAYLADYLFLQSKLLINLETAAKQYYKKFNDLEKKLLGKVPGIAKISVDLLNQAKKIPIDRFKVKNLYDNYRNSQEQITNLLNLHKSISTALLKENVNKLKIKMQEKLSTTRNQISKLQLALKSK